MDDTSDPTVIRNSVKDLNRFLSVNRSREKADSSSDFDSSVRMRLNFSDTFGPDNSYSDLSSSNELSFMKKHQQNIAGFDITKKIREKDKEILENKTTITVLKSKLQSFEASYKRTRLEHDEELDNYRRNQLRDKKMIEDLEFKVKLLQNRERDVKEESLRIKKVAELSCSQVEKKMLNLQTSSLEKCDQLKEEISQLRDRVAVLEKEARENSSKFQSMELKNKDLEERVQSLCAKASEREERILELESSKIKLGQADVKLKEYELRLESLKDHENAFQTWEKTMKQLPALKNEILKLREENSMHKITGFNISLLEEKLSCSETQRNVFENRCKELTAENATLVALRELSENYESVLKEEFNLEYLPPVSEFVELIRALKKKDEDVVSSLSELKASLDSHAHSKDEQQVMIKQLTDTVKKHEEAIVKNSKIIKRCQRQIFLLSKERDNLKDIISSYESEFTMNPSKVERNRILHLESQLCEYKEEVAKLEEELDELQNVESYISKRNDGEKSNEKEDYNENAKIQQLEKTVAELSEENEALKLQLEHHEVKGIYNPKETKVLQFKDNPLERAYQNRKEEYNKLIEENEAMKKRIKLLEEGDNQDLTQKVGLKVNTDGPSSKQVKELEEKMNSLETRNKRLIDAFRLKSQEMREVVYRLTGYRVDLRGDNHYRLSNMYSESPEDYLLFEQTSQGELNLLQTEFSATLGDLINSYLRQEHSFPAFLSTLTLNLFQGQTMQQPSSSDQEGEEYEGGEEDEEEEFEGRAEEEEEDEYDEREEEDETRAEEEVEGGHGPEEDDDEEEEEDEDDDDDEEEEEGDYVDDMYGRPLKRRRTEDQEEEEEEEEEEDDDELICLD